MQTSSFFSSFTTMTIIIPHNLPANVTTWTTEHVKQFIEANKIQYQIDDDEIQIFNRQKYKGRNLLKLETKDLLEDGLPRGPAMTIVELFDALKKDKGFVETGK
jgi:hypothetical protein